MIKLNFGSTIIKTNKPSYIPAGLKVVPITNVSRLIFPLEDSKFQTYIPTINIGDTVLKNQEIAYCENDANLKIIASMPGVVIDINTATAPLPQKQANAIIIQPSEQFIPDDVTSINLDSYKALSNEDIIAKIVKANIQGLGGGLFQAYKKLNAKKIDTIILNGVECEPILNCDEAIMDIYLKQILTGGLILKQITSANKLDITVKENKKALINRIKDLIANNTEFNNIGLTLAQDKYPSGAEKTILENQYSLKLNACDHATSFGYLMNNVMTALSIFKAVNADITQTERVVSVFGKNFENSKNIIIPIGTSLHDLCNFLNVDKSYITNIKMGGIMMGNRVDITSNFKLVATLKSSNAIILNMPEKNNESDCINCGDCISVCPVDLLPNKMLKASKEQDFNNKHLSNINACFDCNLCNLACPSNIKLAETFKYVKQEKRIIKEELERAKYIEFLTKTKTSRLEEETLERERVKALRKQQRLARLAKAKKD